MMPTKPQPATGKPQRSISLFWRTFLLVGLLLLGSIVAWIQTFRLLEEDPRAVQSAYQVASLVNLTRVGLIHADAISRVSLIKALVDQENVQINVREPQDEYRLYNQDRLSRQISSALISRLGPKTIVASEVNGEAGLWIGFEIGEETFWMMLDKGRINKIENTTWLVWLGIAGSLSLLGGGLMARLLNRPLKLLSTAAAHLREGHYNAALLDENTSTTEIREVNIGFNRMAQRLSSAEADRTLMLAGISHDLRTPLSRLLLEIEMSVPDAATRELMVQDVEQVNTIIDKFMDYARNTQAQGTAVPLHDVVDAAAQPLLNSGLLQVQVAIPETVQVLADAVELRRVFTNLLENAIRYGKSPSGMAEVEVSCQAQGPRWCIEVRDHGSGVHTDELPKLTEPFYRSDEARTSANGAGLGLAIVNKTLARMGGTLVLSNHPHGGLVADIALPRA